MSSIVDSPMEVQLSCQKGEACANKETCAQHTISGISTKTLTGQTADSRSLTFLSDKQIAFDVEAQLFCQKVLHIQIEDVCEQHIISCVSIKVRKNKSQIKKMIRRQIS